MNSELSLHNRGATTIRTDYNPAGNSKPHNICRSPTYICRVVWNPQLGLIGSNRRCSLVMETQLTIHHRSLITEIWAGIEKEFDMKFMISLRIMADSYVVLIKFYMLKKRILLKNFYAKELWLLPKPYLESQSLHSWVLSVLIRLSLVEYFCTQGSLTLVTGEAHEQVCFGPCCMTIV